MAKKLKDLEKLVVQNKQNSQTQSFSLAESVIHSDLNLIEPLISSNNKRGEAAIVDSSAKKLSLKE